MDITGESRECSVVRRARRRRQYQTDPAGDNYARTRRSLRARITRKRARIEELEALLSEEKNRG